MGAERETHAAQPDDVRLRILVCPHELVTGGSQIIAIDLATRLRDRGHTVEIYAPPGTLESLIHSRGLAYRAAPTSTGDTVRPKVVRALRDEVRRFSPDIMIAFESPPALAAASIRLRRHLRLAVVVMSMAVSDFIPTEVPLIVGTEQLRAEQAKLRADVHLLEPPIDTDVDAPGSKNDARRTLSLAEDDVVVSVVGRLSSEHHKAVGVAAAIRALDAHDLTTHVTLLIAGDGDSAELVKDAANAVSNSRLDVRLLGNVLDPRPVYDAADIVFGMGASALRAMSHAKPLIVQGRDGYWKLFEPESAPEFFEHGLFGSGTTGGPGVAEIVADLIAKPERRAQLSAFGRTTVIDRYSLDGATDLLERICATEGARSRPRSEASRSSRLALLRFARFKVARSAPGLRRMYRRWTGRS